MLSLYHKTEKKSMLGVLFGVRWRPFNRVTARFAIADGTLDMVYFAAMLAFENVRSGLVRLDCLWIVWCHCGFAS